MTPKRTTSSEQEPRPAKLTVSRKEAHGLLTSRIEKGKDLISLIVSTSEEFELLKKNYYSWNEYNTELLRRIFDTDQFVNEYRSFGWGMASDTLSEQIKEQIDDINNAIRRLESIRERLPLIPEPIEQKSQITTSSNKPNVKTKEVFIVHGTNQGLKDTVARYLSSIDLTPVILHEQPNLGATIIEKLERNSLVGYAIVLLTGDDKSFSGDDSSSVTLRARQNVVFELGYFIGKLGREKVCALYSEGVELPSDFHGVVYIPFDKAGAWRLLLTRELKASGIDIDLNKAI